MFKTLIEINNMTKYIGGRALFEDISFSVSHGEKVGLVGLNGCGKSTLLKIIAGKDCLVSYQERNVSTADAYRDRNVPPTRVHRARVHRDKNVPPTRAHLDKDVPPPDFSGIVDESDILTVESGNIRKVPSGMKIGYLPQWIEFPEKTVGEVLVNALDAAGIDEEWQRDIIQEDLIEKVQISHISPEHPTSLLSGGEKTRLQLAKLLVMNPDFLLLDEPTNFLDIKGLQWIEDFVKNLKQGVLLVSHDRYFLDKVVDRIVEMDHGALFEYTGNYSFYRGAKAERIEQQWEDHRRYKEQVRRLRFQMQRIKQFAENKENSTVNDFIRGRAKIFARKAKAMETRIEKILEVEKPHRDYMANIRFNGSSSSRIIARAENLLKRFGDRVLYSGVNFTIRAGDKLGILGENGSGKTTLLKILQGKESPTSGEVTMLEDDRVGYFSQVFDDLDDRGRIVDLVMDYTGFNLPEARQLLAHFLFFRDDVFKEIQNLSVGERSRVAMACIKGKEPEVLILDEPTNHLDVDTTEILENALMDYGGTIIIVTHDRRLLNSLVEKILVIDDEKITAYPGNYSYYLEKKRMEGEDERVSESRESRLILECRIASLSGKLSSNHLKEEEKNEIQEEFMKLKKELQEIL